MRYFVLAIVLVFGLTGYIARVGQTNASTIDLSRDLIGEWTLVELQARPMPSDVEPFRMKFLDDGRYFLVGPCHRSIGQFYFTARGAQLQPIEIQDNPDCPSDDARALTRETLSTLSDAARVSADSAGDALIFYDRSGSPIIRLRRDS